MSGARRRKPSARRGNVIVISAPSGAGKTTLTRRLLASVPGLKFSISHTTRPPRRREREGREYFFVTPVRFRQMIARGEFAEWAKVFGHFYGTSWRQLRAAQEAGVDVLLDIDVQGYRKLRRRLPEAVSIFILPPSFRELERRLRRRHQDLPQVIRQRLATSRREITRWRDYDYLIVNDCIEQAVAALRTVVMAARWRRTVQERRVKEIFESFGG